MHGIHAVLMANRPLPSLATLSGDYPSALLPIGGKALIVHALEDLAQAHIREATIACPEEDPATLLALHMALGDGIRWGLSLRYIMASPEAVDTAPFDVIATDQDALMIMELDRARTPFAAQVSSAPARQARAQLEVITTGGPAGLTLIPRGACGTMSLFLPGQMIHCGTTAGYFAANLTAVEGRIPGLLIDGCAMVDEADDKLIAERGSKVKPSMLISGQAHVGAFARIGSNTRLSGRVSIGSGSFVGSDTDIHDSIVLPGSRVGSGLHLEGVIVAGSILIDPLTGVVIDAGDPALLGSIGS